MKTNYLAQLIEVLEIRKIYDKEGISEYIAKNYEAIEQGIILVFSRDVYPIDKRIGFIDIKKFETFLQNLAIKKVGSDKYLSQKGLKKLLVIFAKAGGVPFDCKYLSALFNPVTIDPYYFENPVEVEILGKKTHCIPVSLEELRQVILLQGVNPSTAITQASQMRCALYVAGLARIDKYNENDIIFIPTRVIRNIMG